MEATVLDGPQVMTLEEARHCVNEIKRGMADLRYLLLDLDEREGWRALGFANICACAMAEFGYEKSRVYQLLDAARVERNISTAVEKMIPERHLRPLTKIEPANQREVFRRAVETAPEGKMTAEHVEKTVTEWKYNQGIQYGAAASTYRKPEADSDSADIVTTRIARVIFLMMEDEKVRRNPELWFTLEKVAEIANITENGAWRSMQKIMADHVVPLTEMDGKYGIPPRNFNY